MSVLSVLHFFPSRRIGRSGRDPGQPLANGNAEHYLENLKNDLVLAKWGCAAKSDVRHGGLCKKIMVLVERPLTFGYSKGIRIADFV